MKNKRLLLERIMIISVILVIMLGVIKVIKVYTGNKIIDNINGLSGQFYNFNADIPVGFNYYGYSKDKYDDMKESLFASDDSLILIGISDNYNESRFTDVEDVTDTYFTAVTNMMNMLKGCTIIDEEFRIEEATENNGNIYIYNAYIDFNGIKTNFINTFELKIDKDKQHQVSLIGVNINDTESFRNLVKSININESGIDSEYDISTEKVGYILNNKVLSFAKLDGLQSNLGWKYGDDLKTKEYIEKDEKHGFKLDKMAERGFKYHGYDLYTDSNVLLYLYAYSRGDSEEIYIDVFESERKNSNSIEYFTVYNGWKITDHGNNHYTARIYENNKEYVIRSSNIKLDELKEIIDNIEIGDYTDKTGKRSIIYEVNS